MELESTYVNLSNFSLQDEKKEDNLTELWKESDKRFVAGVGDVKKKMEKEAKNF